MSSPTIDELTLADEPGNWAALGFYRGIGARAMDEWTTLRLDDEALARIAAEAADHG